MALNALVDSFLPQSEKCETERVNSAVNLSTPSHFATSKHVQPRIGCYDIST